MDSTDTCRDQTAAPPSVGRLLDKRWQGLSPAQVREVCRASTMREALLIALPFLYEGAKAGTHEWRPGFTDVAFVETRNTGGPDRTSDDRPDSGSSEGWLVVLTCPPGTENGWQSDPSLDRRASLFGSELRSACATRSDDLLFAHEPHPEWSTLALDYWWDARLHEGHTPETAQFLLALLLRPDMKVIYDTATQRPQLVGVSEAAFDRSAIG